MRTRTKLIGSSVLGNDLDLGLFVGPENPAPGFGADDGGADDVFDFAATGIEADDIGFGAIDIQLEFPGVGLLVEGAEDHFRGGDALAFDLGIIGDKVRDAAQGVALNEGWPTVDGTVGGRADDLFREVEIETKIGGRHGELTASNSSGLVGPDSVEADPGEGALGSGTAIFCRGGLLQTEVDPKEAEGVGCRRSLPGRRFSSC